MNYPIESNRRQPKKQPGGGALTNALEGRTDRIASEALLLCSEWPTWIGGLRCCVIRLMPEDR
ncbi:hypothetical protein FRC07_008910, partial [Ceratobasidium sp. 392]